MRKEYENLRIVTVDGSTLVKHSSPSNYTSPLCTVKNGKLDRDKFGGILDVSLDTEKLCEVYQAHAEKMLFPFIDGENYTRALVTVSFEYVIREYERYGRRFVKWGYTVTDKDMNDHVCIRDDVLVAIEVAYDDDKKYSPVETPIAKSMLGKGFVYSETEKAYKLSGKDFAVVMNTQDIRQRLYQDGFYMDGMHYVRYKRSAGSSREGQCLFIAEPLYKDMMAWASCGLSADGVADQASWQAYISLTLSNIEDTIELPKESILIIPDCESIFETYAVCVSQDENDGLTAKEGMTTVRNSIFDGEALLDASVFENSGYEDKGMMLLRNRFFKTCAFNTNLQDWFADNSITEVEQLGGYTVASKVEDIKLVITESSLKYLKFMPKGTPYSEGFKLWLDNLYLETDTVAFGIVKTDKPPQYVGGLMAYTNYQLLNTLALTDNGIEEFLKPSFEFLDKIRKNTMFMRYHINCLSYATPKELAVVNAENYRRKMIFDMLRLSENFDKTEMYKTFRKDTCSYFRDKLRRGRVLVDGNYEVIFGNPYEFLVATIDKNFEATEPLLLVGSAISTKRFDEGEKLLCARSPHITMGNLFVTENFRPPELDDYFNLSREIVCINAIDHNIQQRLNGCDYDSDTMLITNNVWLVEGGDRPYRSLAVPVCMVEPSGKTEYTNTPESLAQLDIRIANNKIGDIINLSQFINCLLWDQLAAGKQVEDIKPMYYDICKLAVMSGMEIDKAKRLYPISADSVLGDLKKYSEEFKKVNGKMPNFYLHMTKKDTIRGNKATLNTPLSYLYDRASSNQTRADKSKTVKLIDLFDLATDDGGGNDTYHKQEIISAIISASVELKRINKNAKGKDNDTKKILNQQANEIFRKCMENVARNITSDHVLHMVLKELDNKNSKYKIGEHRSLVFAMLFYEPSGRLKSRIKNSEEYECDNLCYYDQEADEDSSEFYVLEEVYGHPHVRIFYSDKPQFEDEDELDDGAYYDYNYEYETNE